MGDIKTGYVVRYVRHDKHDHDGATYETTVLFGIHPLIWANTPPEIFRKNFWNEVTGWEEFRDEDGTILASFKGGVLDCEVSGEEPDQ